MNPINLLTGSFVNTSLDAMNAQFINWRIVENKLNTVYQYIIVPTPGLPTYYSDIPKTPIRALYQKDGIIYTVAGNSLYKLTSSLELTELGQVNNSTTPMNIVSNFEYLFLSDSQNAYYYNIVTDDFQELIDTDFPFTTSTVVACRDFFFAHEGKTLMYSAVNNPAQWDALDTVASESTQETIMALDSYKTFVIVKCRSKSEIYQIVGGEVPVKSLVGVLPLFGSIAAKSGATGDRGAYFLATAERGGRQVIMITEEFSAEPISNRGFQLALNRYTTVSDAIGFCYNLDGMEYYQLTFPSEDATWLYCATTKIWFELRSLVNGYQRRHNAEYCCTLDSKVIVSVINSSVLYELDNDTYTDAGNSKIRRTIRTAPIISPKNKELLHRCVQVSIENGEALPGTEPQFGLRFAPNGRNFNQWDIRQASEVGDYDTQLLWHNQGKARKGVYEFEYDEANKICILGMWLDFQELST